MATISPATTYPAKNLVSISWSGLATGDTINQSEIPNVMGLAGSVQMEGTWGSATIVLQVSNDGTNWNTLKDINGSDISLTADGMREFSTAARFIKPTPSGGTGDSINITIALRG
jgi:hypothetical protein